MAMVGYLLTKLKFTKMKTYFNLILSSLLWTAVQAQEHEQKYFPPSDPLVQAKLDTWQDFKFGQIRYKGEKEPVDQNKTDEGKQRNRRVDFRFI